MSKPIGYIEVNAFKLQCSCERYMKFHFIRNYQRLREAIKSLMKRRTGWPWARRNWTRQEAKKYLLGSECRFGVSRMDMLLLNNWELRSNCRTLWNVAKNAGSEPILVDIETWNHITHYR